MKKFLQKITMIITAVALFFAPYESLIIHLVSADSSYKYLSDIQEAYVKVGYGTFKKNKNESNEMISLMIEHQRTYSMNALYAHAPSSIIYNLHDYTNFDMFSAYVGVDASRGNAGNVVFHIYGSKADSYEKNEWKLLKSSNALKGNSEAEKITASVEGYHWLKLEASPNGDNSSDHAVYFDAMIYDSKNYDSSKKPTVNWIKTVEEYDADLQKETDENIVKNKELKLKLLQRTLVKRVGYPILQAFVNKNERNMDFFSWLFNNEDNLEEYLLGGTPEGYNYLQALTVFEELYFEHKEDLNDENNGATYKKMMMAISLAYGSDVNFWQTANKPVEPVRTPSYPLKRYEVLKQLLNDGYTYDGVSTQFEKDIFKNLEIEEMRWVVNNRISDEEIPWLNWYTQKTKSGQTQYGPEGYKNPYNYIYYDGGFRWKYEDPEYYKKDSTYCATEDSSNFHKSQTDKGYKRGASCNEKYGLKNFKIETGEKAPLRLWTIWEEDGVCGSLAGTGSNIEMAYGVPSSLVSQPGHAAYFVSSLKETADGKKVRIWNIGNAAAGWARSYKGERMLLDWGSKTYKWVDTNNAAYILIAQRALDEFDKYKEAFIYNLIADVRTDIKAKINAYERALQVQNYNVDSWYGLIQTLLQDESTTDNNYYEVAQKIMTNLKEFPLPMYDLLKLFNLHIKDNLVAYSSLLDKTLTEQSKFTEKDSLQYGAINDIAKYLLGIKENNDIATFSFDGKNAGFLMLAGTAKENKMPFEYTLNYEYDAEHKKISENTKWIEVTDGSIKVDLRDQIKNMDETKDIVVHLLSTSRDSKIETEEDIKNLFFIDLTEGENSKNIYQNINEQRFAGIDENVAEWTMLDTDEKLEDFFNCMYKATTEYNSLDWHKFNEELPKFTKEGGEMIAIRNGYTKTYFPSEPSILFMEPIAESNDYSYVPFSRQTVTTSSSLNEGDEAKLVDRGRDTYWTSAKGDEHADVTIALKNSIQFSKLEYFPGIVSDLGIMTKAKIEVSVDGKKWDVVADEVSWAKNNDVKTYIPTKPVRARYIKITALDSTYDYVCAAMFNIYENKSESYIDVNTLDISYVTNGHTYTGSEIRPSVTVKDGNKELVLDEHYSLDYKDNVEAGKGKITLIGLGAYDGEKELEFDIGKAKAPVINIAEGICVDKTKNTVGDIGLPKGWHWKDSNLQLNVGENTAIAVYYDTKNYEETEVEIKIVKEKGSRPKINITQKNYSFELTGEEQKTLEKFKETITISDEEDEDISIENTEKVSINSDINWQEAGTYHIVVTVTDSDGNTSTDLIQIVIKPKDNEVIELTKDDYVVEIENENLFYNGQEHNIIVKVRKNVQVLPQQSEDKENDPVAEIMTLSLINNNVSSHELTEGVDYTLEFSELTKAGDHVVKITGIGIYSGELTANYKINKAQKPTEMIHPEMKVSGSTTRLDQIYLDGNWQWADASMELKEGENTVKIIFLGDDNHEKYETEILVIREKDDKPTPPPSNPEPSKPSGSETKPSESETSKENNDSSSSNKETTTKKPSSSNNTTTNEQEENNTTSEENKTEEKNDSSTEEVKDNETQVTDEEQQEQDEETENTEENVVEETKTNNSVAIVAVVAASFVALSGLIFLLIKMR